MDSNGLPPITTDEQLRAWLLELDKHQPAHVLQVCSELMTNETGDPSKTQRKLVKQVIASHKAGDGGIAHALKGLFGVFSLSKVGWQACQRSVWSPKKSCFLHGAPTISGFLHVGWSKHVDFTCNLHVKSR